MGGKTGLGKGLGAIFGEAAMTLPSDSDGAVFLPLQKIEPNPLQPRKNFDPEALDELAESIRLHGVIQPLTVRKLPSGFYQIIAGERRWRAARKAGLEELPVVIIEADDRKAAELALIENLQRADLNPIEEASGYRRLMDEYHMTQETAAERVGKSRPAVANALRLLSLTPRVLAMVENGSLSAGHGRALLAVRGELEQYAVAQKAINLQLSVRQTENMCRKLAKATERVQTTAPAVDYIAECEKTLRRSLGRGVRIHPGAKKGRVELEYYGDDDLQQLYEALQKLERREKTE